MNPHEIEEKIQKHERELGELRTRINILTRQVDKILEDKIKYEGIK